MWRRYVYFTVLTATRILGCIVKVVALFPKESRWVKGVTEALKA